MNTLLFSRYNESYKYIEYNEHTIIMHSMMKNNILEITKRNEKSRMTHKISHEIKREWSNFVNKTYSLFAILLIFHQIKILKIIIYYLTFDRRRFYIVN